MLLSSGFHIFCSRLIYELIQVVQLCVFFFLIPMTQSSIILYITESLTFSYLITCIVSTCWDSHLIVRRLLMLKHKKMVENCRGDGVSTCRICNKDFTHQRSSRPEPIHYCQDCHKVSQRWGYAWSCGDRLHRPLSFFCSCLWQMICGRCGYKSPRKSCYGDERMLCIVCYDEREVSSTHKGNLFIFLHFASVLMPNSTSQLHPVFPLCWSRKCDLFDCFVFVTAMEEEWGVAEPLCSCCVHPIWRVGRDSTTAD